MLMLNLVEFKICVYIVLDSLTCPLVKILVFNHYVLTQVCVGSSPVHGNVWNLLGGMY